MKKNNSKLKSRSSLPNVRYLIDMYKEGKYFVGIARGLDYTGIGKTIDEAIKNTNKSVKLALEWCYSNKTFETVLKEAGFEPHLENNRKVWVCKNYLGSFSEEVA